MANMANLLNPIPNEYLETTPPGISAADADAFRDIRELLLPGEIGTTPPIDQNDPTSVASGAQYRANKARVMTELARRSRLVRAALTASTAAAAAPVAAGATIPIPTVGTASTQPTVPANFPGTAGTGPRCGGTSVNYGTAMVWTGGGRTVKTALTEPKSILAYRPSEFKEHSRIVEKCQVTLVDDYRLGVPQDIFKSEGITLRLWNDKVKKELENRGMDGEFHVSYDGVEETYLLAEFGKADHDAVEAWIDHLRVQPCRYETENLQMSATFLLGSIKIELLEMVERNIRENATGPEVYSAIVSLHQRVSISAVRKLVDVLDKMSIKNEPGEDVQKFTGKVTDIAKRIIGTGSPPGDLVALIYKAFVDCSVESFRITVLSYYERADAKDPEYNNWETWLLRLTTRYQRECDNNKWGPKQHHKESAALTGLVSGDSDSRTCYHCGKKGHIKPHCPDRDKPAVGGTTAAGGRSSNRTAPGDGAPHTKTIDGVTHSWCGTCKRWNSGKKAHLTADHKVRTKTEEVSTVVPVVPVANVLATAPAANIGTVSTGYPLETNPYFLSGYIGAVQEVSESTVVDCRVVAFDDDESGFDRDGDLDLSDETLDLLSEMEWKQFLEKEESISEEEWKQFRADEAADAADEAADARIHLNCQAGRR